VSLGLRRLSYTACAVAFRRCWHLTARLGARWKKQGGFVHGGPSDRWGERNGMALGLLDVQADRDVGVVESGGRVRVERRRCDVTVIEIKKAYLDAGYAANFLTLDGFGISCVLLALCRSPWSRYHHFMRGTEGLSNVWQSAPHWYGARYSTPPSLPFPSSDPMRHQKQVR
jgi:hypothetical protein